MKTSVFSGKKIILGVCGGIAAYKSAELVSRLVEFGAAVQVVMTQNAKEFITPLTFQALSGHPVRADLFDLNAEAGMGHIELARWADAIVIAPATAQMIAQLAAGMADDLLTTLCLASSAPLMMAPAMNQAMWRHVATQTNVQVLQQRNAKFLGPAEGKQACGDIGPGRMIEPQEILNALHQHWVRSSLLRGEQVVITAGPTREAIDPVRYISNHSSGKMGFALADAASAMGAKVTLISGPVSLSPPANTQTEFVITAEEMLAAVKKHMPNCTLFIGAAAVADYRCSEIAMQKISKRDEHFKIDLVRNPDILAYVATQKLRPFTVGFAAQTHDLEKQAREKLVRKKLDIIVANAVNTENTGFNHDTNACVLISALGEQETLPLMSKRELAWKILEWVYQQRQMVNKVTKR